VDACFILLLRARSLRGDGGPSTAGPSRSIAIFEGIEGDGLVAGASAVLEATAPDGWAFDA
jgi:hypothetical protein